MGATHTHTHTKRRRKKRRKKCLKKNTEKKTKEKRWRRRCCASRWKTGRKATMKYFPCGPLGLSSVIVLLLFEARALVDRWRSGKEMLGISAASLWHPCGISEASPASRPSAPTALIPNEPAVAGFVSGILGISKCWAWILGISGIPSLFVAPMKADLGLPHSK